MPQDRTIDGRDILPVLSSSAPSPHEALFGISGSQLRSVRAGRWKLHVLPPAPGRDRVWKPDEPYLDPRRPDGVRLLAPYEQAHPIAHPGITTGDPATAGALFDLDADPAEQHNVAVQHPETVAQLQRLYDAMLAQMPSAP